MVIESSSHLIHKRKKDETVKQNTCNLQLALLITFRDALEPQYAILAGTRNKNPANFPCITVNTQGGGGKWKQTNQSEGFWGMHKQNLQ